MCGCRAGGFLNHPSGFGDDGLGGIESSLVMRPQGGDRGRRQVTRRLESRDLLVEDEFQPLGFRVDEPERERGEPAVLEDGRGALDEIRAALALHALPVRAHLYPYQCRNVQKGTGWRPRAS
jgi:hypothetical protein